MPVEITRRRCSSVEIEGRDEGKPRLPSWFGEAVLLGKYWLESGLVGYLEEEVRVVRGRMGQYEVIDFVLLLNSYGISGERTIADFYRTLEPVKEVLMSVWGRLQCPSASSLSRFLGAVDRKAVASLGELFSLDLSRNGLRVMQGLGVFDRSEDHYVVFDVDGTVCAVRQRWLSQDQGSDPPGRRRSESACAPGYKGRKRGEVCRNRTTIAQAQTSEWLGTYGGAGNGDAKGELERACAVIRQYLEKQGLNVAHGLVRLDGLYGTASMVSVVQQQGLGYILRCRDYHLLKDATVQRRMQAAASWEWHEIGGNSFTQVLDLGYIEDLGRGYAAPMRVIILRTPVKLHKVKVGKRVKDYVYELILTSQSCASLSELDVVSIYRGRAGFEQRLSEEDQEQDYDRWCSWKPEGQEFWQVLAQWSWNWRVWMGWQQSQAQVRQTIWAEAEESDRLSPDNPLRPPAQEPELSPSLMFLREGASSGDCKSNTAKAEEMSQTEAAEGALNAYGPMRVSTEWGRGRGKGNRFGNEDFQIVDKKTVLCPAGNLMHRRTTQQRANGDLAIQFSINARTCQRCPVKKRCLAPHSKGVGGRRVNVVRQALTQVRTAISTCSAVVRSVSQWLKQKQPRYEHPIFWCDIAARRLRREWHQCLELHEVEIKKIMGDQGATKRSSLLTRRQRRHERFSWWERLERNERAIEAGNWVVVLCGEAKAIVSGLRVLISRSFAIG